MLALEAHARQCGLEHSLLELVKTRVSQINGRAYCLVAHQDARAAARDRTAPVPAVGMA
jgi:AhpD family alkylhydroperoxidase